MKEIGKKKSEEESTTRLIKTDYPGVVRAMYPELRLERKLPYRDNFLLLREISYNDKLKFDRFTNYIVISKNYFEEEWTRETIIMMIKKMIKSRRKPEFEKMSDDEFEAAAKVFLLTGYWPPDAEETGVFEMFKKIDKTDRFALFFNIIEKVHEKALFYALLTFAAKAMDLKPDEVSAGYLRILKSKERVIKRNFIPALNNYSKAGEYMDDDMRILRFIYDLGQVTI